MRAMRPKKIHSSLSYDMKRGINHVIRRAEYFNDPEPNESNDTSDIMLISHWPVDYFDLSSHTRRTRLLFSS